jgi:membrane fusion protein, heavy metal efflux system
MFMQATKQCAPVAVDSGKVKPIAATPSSAQTVTIGIASPATAWRKSVKGLAVALILVILAGFTSHLLGVQIPGLGGPAKDDKVKDGKKDVPPLGVSLVSGKPHTLEVSEDARTALGIRKGKQELLAVAQEPTAIRPLILSGSTMLDPGRLARIRARFAPCRVVQIGQVHDFSKTGESEFRELRSGDHVSKGDILGVVYSVDVGSKKNDLLNALAQLELDQQILDNAEKHREAIAEVQWLTFTRAVRADRNAINAALNYLNAWDIPQGEIDTLREEAKKLSADKDAWSKTPEGRWVKGEKRAGGYEENAENPWGKVTLRAPFDGVIIECNVAVKEMVVDNTVNLFQIADVSRLLVKADAPEDELPTLEALLRAGDAHWTVRTVGAPATGLPGTIHEIGYLIDPNQHTAVIKGYIDNPGDSIRGTQFASASVKIPPPKDAVEIQVDALVDDGKQSVVFVQTDAAKHQYTMRRVQVTHRFDRRVFVRSAPIPKEERLTPQEAEEGLLPKEPLRPGERVLGSGAVELKAALLELASQPEKEPSRGDKR